MVRWKKKQQQRVWPYSGIWQQNFVQAGDASWMTELLKYECISIMQPGCDKGMNELQYVLTWQDGADPTNIPKIKGACLQLFCNMLIQMQKGMRFLYFQTQALHD